MEVIGISAKQMAVTCLMQGSLGSAVIKYLQYTDFTDGTEKEGI
jgi:hypothetical protein